MRYLDWMGAEANVNRTQDSERLTHILLRPGASKAGVLEEFLHGTQDKLGLLSRGEAYAEWHVEDFMVRHAHLLQLGEEDVKILKVLRDRDRSFYESQQERV